ncbi:hypothetical protein EV714DRAFT_242226 [Schizophyllum commune]
MDAPDPEALLRYKIDHFFTPPRLPQHYDGSPYKDRDLIAHVACSGGEFRQQLAALGNVEPGVLQYWERVVSLLNSFRRVCLGEGAPMDPVLLARTVNGMAAGDVLALHIGAQNAGVILRKVSGQELTFESFFASLPAATVTGTKGKVVAQFPSSPRLPFPADPELIAVLCGYLAEMHTLEFPDALPKTKKAGNTQAEYRDSTNPWYITDFVTSVVRSFSADKPGDTLPHTDYIVKRLGDHVLWENAELPWRRSPILLVLKVALQSTLSGIPTQYGYKAFMVFMLSRLTSEAAAAGSIADDVLHVMASKIAQRVYKLRAAVSADRFPIDDVLRENEAIDRLLQAHWKAVQQEEAQPIDLSPPTPEEIAEAKVLSLEHSRAYLDEVIARDERLKQASSTFDAAHFEAGLKKSSRRNGCSPPRVFSPGDDLCDVLEALHDVSEWLESDRPLAWMDTTNHDARLPVIRDLLECGLDVLSRFMKLGNDSDPELFSLALLNVLDLWVFMDKTAVDEIPLLAQYEPELTVEPLAALLLRRKGSMERLIAIERYIRGRSDNASCGSVYTLDPNGHCGSAFGARYAAADSELCRLRHRVMEAGERAKTAKRREHEDLEQKCSDLKSRARLLSHEYYKETNRWGGSWDVHATSWCDKCSLEKEADNLKITVFEEPLPKDPHLANALVFEMSVPPWFALWRSMTLRLIRETAGDFEAPDRAENHTLAEYTGLQSSIFGVNAGKCDTQVTLASDHKSFLIAHYSTRPIPCSENDVLKNHGPRWHLYDQSSQEYLPSVLPQMDLRDHCTLPFSPGPYTSLRWTLSSTAHTPNQVIASQSKCSPSLSLHEWEAFGNLRSGERLQWHNLALQLEVATLKLGEQAVHILMRQAALQVESASSDWSFARKAHATLADDSFALQLLNILRCRLAVVQDNWEEGWVASTLSLVAHRLCELMAPSGSAVRSQVLTFLRDDLRPVCMRWMREIMAVLRSTPPDSDIETLNDLRHRLIQAGLAARDTYRALDDPFDTAPALSDYLECCLVLHQNLPLQLSKLPISLRILAQQDVDLSVCLLSPLLDAITSGNDGIDGAIRNTWPAFARDAGAAWTRIPESRWVTCRTSASQPRTVHFDVLGGAIFVDGASFQALPSDILGHPLYQEVFPSQYQMPILPSSMAGMTYQCQYQIDGHQVHFCTIGSDLVIRAQNQDGHVSEFVPRSKLKGDIPNQVLFSSIALYRTDKVSLDFVPVDKRLGWKPLAQPTWTLHHVATSPELLLCAQLRQILCPRSKVALRLSHAFLALEKTSVNVVVETSTSATARFSSVTAHLPRYRLMFSFDERGDLASKEFPSHVVSTSQAIGTLYGVEKLVLKPCDPRLEKRILIPSGKILVHVQHRHPHISTSPPTDTIEHIDLHIMNVNTIGGQVKTDGNLDSSLTLTYMHALSSSHLPDPLTGERGTDRALRMLETASSYAFTDLSAADVQALLQILSLTPVRRYYPEHLQAMETICWGFNISPLSQSELFAPLVASIVDFAARKSVFDKQSTDGTHSLVKFDGEDSLRVRAFHRTARLSPYTEDYWKMHAFGLICEDHHAFSWPSQATESGSRIPAVQDVSLRMRSWESNIAAIPQLWSHFEKWTGFTSAAEPLSLSRPCLLSDYSQPALWFSLYRHCLSMSAQTAQYPLMFIFALVTYESALDDALVASLMCTAVHAARNWNAFTAADANLPRSAFTLNDGWELGQAEMQTLRDTVRRSLVPFDQSSEYRSSRLAGEDAWAYEGRCRRAYQDHSDRQIQGMVEHLRGQWPCAEPHWPYNATSEYPLLDISQLREAIDKLFRSMHQNLQLHNYALGLQRIFDAIPIQQSLGVQPLPSPQPYETPQPQHDIPDLWTVMSSRTVPPEEVMPIRVGQWVATSQHDKLARSPVHELVDRLPAESGLAAQYKQELRDCTHAMDGETPSDSKLRIVVQESTAPALLQKSISDAVGPRSSFEQALFSCGIWPNACVRNCLSYLSLPRRGKMLNSPWMRGLTLLALSLVRLQREQRLDTQHVANYDKELSTNVGDGFDAFAHPDWLLIQLDSNMTIRLVQAEIAQRMMSPHNRVMQLNMGEGKSSVIIPITSMACADGNNLACVIVLKSLCSQMFQILSQRISGLANRRLYYLPFSRDTEIDGATVQAIGGLFKECASNGGILLCQPEHLLSFQLMGSSMLCSDGMSADTRSLLELQDWVSEHSRYLLDESDEILSHKYQLIYTVGNPGPLEGHPERWLVLQKVLSLVSSNVAAVMLAHPDGVEVEPGCSAIQQFRRVRILTDAACDHLFELCCADIVHRNAIPLLPFRSYPISKVDAVLQFISAMDTSSEIANDLEAYSGETYRHLLLLRGLFAHGILKLAFKEKRWRVDYGLDHKRSRLAVPYRAKDSPALRAEFGHPDVILVLTSLSYYYGGLSNSELDITFDHLLRTDNPALRYDDWTRGLDLPPNLQTLKGINLKDANQRINVVYPALRRVKSVVDFYLAECVFPKEARQFDHKLTTNPWDIARKKGQPTTGFSGTNDNKYLLPTSIVQEDMPSQQHTNALVLDYVLRPENRTVICKDCNAIGIIEEAVRCEPYVSVILDVGAQVLEFTNEEMARRWLERDTRESVEAVVYFGPNDELCVLTRDGRVEQLKRSFYRDQLGKTLVYLDEAHTRGTDLKLPDGTRALVTLGPKQAKDKLMQGCMRMRKLGCAGGHSVLFLASSEIESRIRDCIKDSSKELDSSDVLEWTMHETIRQTTENGALWVNQGLNFDVRQTAWEAFNGGRLNEDELISVLLEREAHPLKDLYGPRDTTEESDNAGRSDRQREIFQRSERFGFAVSRSSRLLEEQERELAHEKESEREVEGAPPAKAKPHAVSPALKTLVQTGSTSLASFYTLYDCLDFTSVQSEVGAASTAFFRGRHILATVDFKETIELAPRAQHEKDGFIRPVQWIVTTNAFPDVLLLISPFEADKIIADIRRSPTVRLHVYSPRVSRNMRAFDDLKFLITPSAAASSFLPPASITILELNLFACNLFLRDKDAFRQVCQLLGLHLGEIPDALKGRVGVDGFVSQQDDRDALGIVACLFEKSPSAVLRALLDLRRKGQGFLLTHIGQMLYGNEIGSDEF